MQVTKLSTAHAFMHAQETIHDMRAESFGHPHCRLANRVPRETWHLAPVRHGRLDLEQPCTPHPLQTTSGSKNVTDVLSLEP